MYKIALCDADNVDLENNLTLLKRYLQERKLRAEFESYTAPDELLNNLNHQHIFILDVKMPTMDGMQLGEQIKRVNPAARLLYISGDEKYAIDAYKLKAEGYLIKPVWKPHFYEILDGIFQKLKEDMIFIQSDRKDVRLFCKTIKYVDCINRALVYHTDEEDIKTNCVRTTIKKTLEELLHNQSFHFIPPGLCVNLMRIKELGRNFITFDTNETIYFPKSKWEELRTAWMKSGEQE